LPAAALVCFRLNVYRPRMPRESADVKGYRYTRADAQVAAILALPRAGST
jgi:hypothetical protein